MNISTKSSYAQPYPKKPNITKQKHNNIQFKGLNGFFKPFEHNQKIGKKKSRLFTVLKEIPQTALAIGIGAMTKDIETAAIFGSTVKLLANFGEVGLQNIIANNHTKVHMNPLNIVNRIQSAFKIDTNTKVAKQHKLKEMFIETTMGNSPLSAPKDITKFNPN